MNLSLKLRIMLSFVVANLVVWVLTFTVFNFLNSLNREIESITAQSTRIVTLTDEIRISAVSILKYQRRLLTEQGKNSSPMVERITSLCESFTSQLQSLDTLYQDPDIKKVIAQMLSYVDSLKVVLNKASLFHRDAAGMASIGELADKILESYSEFQDYQYVQGTERDKKVRKVINDTKRSMMITLIIGFLGTIILGLVIPGKIALPFKKIKDAIRELQNCNFDVSIYYTQQDEIGEIANEMNKMIENFKEFDELRTDRISLEHRKFDALANLVKKPVLVANAEGKIMYMNNTVFSLLQLQSEDVINKEMRETLMPMTIIESFELAIKRRSKIENARIKIFGRKGEKDVAEELKTEAEEQAIAQVSEKSDKLVTPTKSEGEDRPLVFDGYGNIIPIRGKESSLDYYLMVLSLDVFQHH